MRICRGIFSRIAVLIAVAIGATALATTEVRTEPVRHRTLLVAMLDDSRVVDLDFTNRYQHLLAVRFAGGRLVAVDTVVSNCDSQLRFTCQRSYLIRDRWVICDTGDIVDIVERKYVFRGGHGREFMRYRGIEGDRVLIHQPSTDRLISVDLFTGDTTYTACRTDSSLPGVVSPSGRQSLDHGGAGGCQSEIWLHRPGEDPRILADGFHLERAMASSVFGEGAPLFWLDEQRILTQTDNGKIVLLRTDGTVEPVVEIELPSSTRFEELIKSLPTLESQRFACMGAHFEHGPDGTVVYKIVLGPAVDRKPFRAYTIDVEEKTYCALDTDWIDLEHGFEAKREADAAQRAVRYRSESIGSQDFNFGIQCSGPGVLAVGRGQAGSPRATFAVWFEADRLWQVVTLPSGGTLSSNALIGWLDEDRNP